MVVTVATIGGAVVGAIFHDNISHSASRLFFKGRGPAMVRDVTVPVVQHAATPVASTAGAAATSHD